MSPDEENQNKPRGFRITQRVELHFLRTCLLNALGLLLAWAILPSSIVFTDFLSFIILVVLIWFMNWILRPILVVFTLRFIIFTMGVGMLFINAVIIYFAARLIPGNGVVIGSYWAALLASFIISVMSWGLEMARSERSIRKALSRNAQDGGKDKDDDVIDV